eukprot:Hpha_TRINITY_DN98_c0_g2::TRINITY_DN98_c0_g2_i1::g.110060::m.110060
MSAAASEMRNRGNVGEDDETDEEEEERRHNNKPFERVKNFLFSALWLGASVYAAHRADIVGVLLHSQLIRRWTLYVALAVMSVTVVVCTWLTYNYEPEEYQDVVCEKLPGKPKAIPLATASWIVGSCILAYAIWPVYHVLTFPMLFLFLMGFISLIAFVSRGKPSEKDE